MIVHMNSGITQDDERVKAVCLKAQRHGLNPEVHTEEGSHFAPVEIYLKDDKETAASQPEYLFENMDGVKQVVRVSPSKVSAAMNGGRERHSISIGESTIGPNYPCLLVAGPCAADQYVDETVGHLAMNDIRHFRFGWRKPRSRAEAFRGFGYPILVKSLEAAKKHSMQSAWTEVIESCDIDDVRRAKQESGFEGDIVLWVGARNTGNYRLLEELGKQNDFIVMLKNGLYMTKVEELMDKASWVLYGPMHWNEKGELDVKKSAPAGNNKLIFCVRGLEKHDRYDRHRFYPNYTWITELHEASWAPVCLDPSHMAGETKLVYECIKSGLTYLPDVIMVESHVSPDLALCDKDQAVPASHISVVKKMIDDHNQSRQK